MYAAYHFIVKNHSYLYPRKFTLRVDNIALSRLKAYSTDQDFIGRWIMTLEMYHFSVDHRPRKQYRKADRLWKRTNDYRCREQQLEKLPPVAECWNFLSQEEYEPLPTAPSFNPDLPPHLGHVPPTPPSMVYRIIRRTQRTKRRKEQKEVTSSTSIACSRRFLS